MDQVVELLHKGAGWGLAEESLDEVGYGSGGHIHMVSTNKSFGQYQTLAVLVHHHHHHHHHHHQQQQQQQQQRQRPIPEDVQVVDLVPGTLNAQTCPSLTSFPFRNSHQKPGPGYAHYWADPSV
jgi:hypothetical protein